MHEVYKDIGSPYDPNQTPNYQRILNEIDDVEYRIKQVKAEIALCK